MALEDLTGTKYIDSLVATNPTATDGVSEGDDHLRGIKNVLKTTFPSVSGAVNATHTELNELDASGAAISNYVSGIRTYIGTGDHDGGVTLSINTLMASGAAFESIGPTGSSADNIWSAMDNMPTTAKIAIVSIEVELDPSASGSACSITILTKQTGATASVLAFRHQTHATTLISNYASTQVLVPLDASRRFSVQWTGDNVIAASSSITLELVGFMA